MQPITEIMPHKSFPINTIADCEAWIADHVWSKTFDYSGLAARDKRLFEAELASVIRTISWEIDRLGTDSWSLVIGHAGGLCSVAGLAILPIASAASLGIVATAVGGAATIYGYGRALLVSPRIDVLQSRMNDLREFERRLPRI